MKKITIPYQFLKDASYADAWDTLAYLVWLKSKFGKTIYYNYTGKSLGGLLKLSPTTALKHVNLMIHLDWAYVKDGHLFITPIDNFKVSSLLMVPFASKKSDQITHLKGLIIRNSIAKQSKKIEKKGEAVRKSFSTFDLKRYKRLRKKGIYHLPEIRINERTTLSNKTIGKIFQRSRRSGSRLQVQMNKLGIIKSEAFFERVHTFSGEKRPHSFLYRNWYPIQRVSNRISITTL